jgi:mannosyltransferase
VTPPPRQSEETADIAATDVIAPNFKKRLSGVTSTIVQLVPVQRARGVRVAVIGPGLPRHLPHLRWTSLAGLWKSGPSRRFRVWHARRNTEMVGGLVLRDLLRMKVRLLFTSAAQRHHKPFTRWLIARMAFLKVPHDVVMHGVDTELFHPSDVPETAEGMAAFAGRRLVGCFGRVRHQKGTDLFVDAMIALLPAHPEWSAVVAGRVTAEHAAFAADLEKRIAQAGLADRIVLLGEVDDIKPWFRRLDLYVAPSRNEGFGLTPLEAMASGTPVVASDAGAYAEMIDHAVSGKVVPAGDGKALTEAVAAYLGDDRLRAAHADAALAHVRANFPLEREADALNAIYRRLMEGADAR